MKFGKVENKEKDVRGLVTNNDFNRKIGEVENKILKLEKKLEKKILIMLSLLPLLNLINFLVKYKMQN